MTLPHLATWQWLLGAACAFFVGVAKTGVPGMGILIVPMMVLAVGDARQAAGWLLPLLCCGDVVAVVLYRRHAAITRLFSLLPWVLVGMAAGAVALGAPELVLRRLVGGIVLGMLALHLVRSRVRRVELAGLAHQASYGAAAGFATTVANAAGPVMNVYLLAKRLPKEDFVATGAWFFLIVNLTKLPIYGYHQLISGRSLAFNAAVLPALAVGAISGRALLRWIPQNVFDATIVVLTAVGAVLLLV